MKAQLVKAIRKGARHVYSKGHLGPNAQRKAVLRAIETLGEFGFTVVSNKNVAIGDFEVQLRHADGRTAEVSAYYGRTAWDNRLYVEVKARENG